MFSCRLSFVSLSISFSFAFVSSPADWQYAATTCLFVSFFVGLLLLSLVGFLHFVVVALGEGGGGGHAGFTDVLIVSP